MSEREVNLDHDRPRRLGFDEAILCGRKSGAQLRTICDQALARGSSLLLTRLDPDHHAELAASHGDRLDYDPVSRTAWFGDVAAPTGRARVAVITAGTSDVPVSREAIRTLAYYGEATVAIHDIGVAGIHRLEARLPDFRDLPVVIAVAGMDAALASVVGGLVPGLVIAVPTSVGYGVAENGWTALRSILVSCAPGVLAVNIDNGYGAACAALRAVRALDAVAAQKP